jgi:uncharacterized protein (TIGR02611 family)
MYSPYDMYSPRTFVGLLFGMAKGLHNPLEWIRLIRTNFRRLVILIIGGIVLLAGIAMMVLPGPGILVIIAGLAILAKEFTWAERTLDKAKQQASKATDKVKGARFRKRKPESTN